MTLKALRFFVLLLPITSALTSQAMANGQQNISIYVPKVALIDVQHTQHQFTFSPNTDTYIKRTKVAITSNSRTALLDISSNTPPPGITLQIQVSENICPTSEQRQSNGQMTCNVGLKAVKNGEVVLTAKRSHGATDESYAMTISSHIR